MPAPMPPASTVPPRLVLGSTSPYRRALLQRLLLAFEVDAPRVDESPRPGEAPAALALRLALEKAQEVASRHPGAVVIGADQVADLDGQSLGKPGHLTAARAQLHAQRGRRVVFQTAVAVVRADTGFTQALLAPVVVHYRDLADAEIERYLQLEQPFDCAGSAKCETLGIALLDRIDSDDPTALIGLPLMRTCALLRQAGIDPLAASA